MDENNQAPLHVANGTHVEVELIAKLGARERMALDLVPDAEADFARGFIGIGTPLARAILDQPADSRIEYHMGDIVQVHILSVRQSETAPPRDTAEKRQALLRQAVDKSDLANALNYALTAENKWGDFDPEGIVENWEQPRTETTEEKSGEEKE
jgi:hypothetical protein